MGNQEREAISVFLLDLYHQKQVKRRMHEVKERFKKEDLLAIVDGLKEKGILDEEETNYLYSRISGLYGN